MRLKPHVAEDAMLSFLPLVRQAADAHRAGLVVLLDLGNALEAPKANGA